MPLRILRTHRTSRHAFATRPVAVARRGMVAAAHPFAVETGLDVLRAGGNAVDAAIATNAALAFAEPTSCGLGGDLFAMVLDPGAGLVGLDGSGRAPLGMTIAGAERQRDGTIPLGSPHSWTVPGCVDGWFALHVRFGRLPMARLLEPVVRAAREGVAVPPVIAAAWAHAAAVFEGQPGFRETFMPGGRAPRAGERFANPALAETLARIARIGRDAFYEGPVATAVAAFAATHGGLLSSEDLARHRSDWVTPLATTYRGLSVWELPPAGQGLAALQMLDILETFDLRQEGGDAAAPWHLMIEAKKLAYEDRARFYADPAFAEVPVAGLLEKGYARSRAALVDPGRAAARLEAGRPRPAGETTILATADGEGMLVSLIQSNYTGFGSGHVVGGLGISLQNRGALFALDPSHANALAPGKRPFHTIIPAFLGEEGRPCVAFGLMGGDMQAQGHAQVVVNLVDHGMDLQEAGDAARFHHTGSSEPTGTLMTDGGVLHLEPGVTADIADGLRARGHRIEPASPATFGGYQAILRDPEGGLLLGASESRKDGMAAGID